MDNTLPLQKEFPHRIRHYLASAYIIWAADPYLEASTINALISAAQSLLDSLPEEYKETYEVKMAIGKLLPNVIKLRSLPNLSSMQHA